MWNVREKVLNLFRTQDNPSSKDLSYPIIPEFLHIEVSYACNLHCMMCPRTFEGVPQEGMSPQVFEKIVPYLSRFRYVHLTGYGEPLLSPNFIEYVRAVREAGARPVVTTNGLLLKGRLARMILEEQIDCISVSIDAGTPQTYEQVRGKGTFPRLIETLHKFADLRRKICPDKTNGHSPFMVWVFILMRAHGRELPQAIEYAIELGFDRVVAKHLECALSREGFDEALFDTGYVPPPDPEIIDDLERVIHESRRIAAGRMDLHIHPYQMVVDGMCLVKPTANLYIDFRGNVSPCCYLGVLDTKPYMETPGEDQGVIGNIMDTPLDEMLHSERYIEFQRAWLEGGVPPVCEGCVQLARMKEQNLSPNLRDVEPVALFP